MRRASFLLLAAFMTFAPRAAAAEETRTKGLPTIQLAPKPVDDAMQRRAMPQPSVPSGYQETPLVETAPEPELTLEEKQRGYLLFHRPIMEPVFPNTKPLDQERLEHLAAFAAPGEFEPLTLGIYPVRELRNLKVRCSPLTCESGQIPSGQIEVRLATYWNVGYPRYTSRSTYRRTPELLERVTVHNATPRECQRYWIRVHVPDDAKPGLYRGVVSVWDDGFDQAVLIPVSLRVLDFKLRSDPAKRYSAYYYVRNRTQYEGKPESFVRKAADNEYAAMVEYGLDMIPTFYLRSSDDGTIELRYAEELDQMLKVGLTGPVPVTADGVISRIYRDTTPGGEQGSHWEISQAPPPAFFARVTAAFKAFEAQRKARNWPEFVCCPMDEVAASRKEFGAGVYAAVKAAGLRTYATKDPTAGDAAPYRPYIDVWCSQPYSATYDKIVAQNRYEYWCYPNHNAGEIKDRRVMCKGGRMTYGFGFWRSGYTTLIPWHWSWTPGRNQFDYLRGESSGCGQRIDEHGEVIPAVYWECFREGKDDARYIYTLQQAAFEREGSPVARVPRRRRRREKAPAGHVGRDPRPAEVPGRRHVAVRGIQHSPLAAGAGYGETAPLSGNQDWTSAVGAGDRHAATPRRRSANEFEQALRASNVESMDLGGDFADWASGTKEGMVEASRTAGRDGKAALRWRVHVDHESDGGEGGAYPVGWPRVSRSFQPGELDLSGYEYLSFQLRVDSDRDEAADDSTRLGLIIGSHKKPGSLFEARIDLGDRQRVWVPQRYSLREMIAEAGLGEDPWRSISPPAVVYRRVGLSPRRPDHVRHQRPRAAAIHVAGDPARGASPVPAAAAEPPAGLVRTLGCANRCQRQPRRSRRRSPLRTVRRRRCGAKIWRRAATPSCWTRQSYLPAASGSN